jgi:short-subunit dehydrogenase
MQIAGASVLITGANGGIGQALARELAGRGGELLLSARRGELLEELAGQLGARTLQADLADAAQVARLAQEAGEVDILVANAALPAAGRLESFTLEEVDRALDVNLRSPIALSHALLAGMLERGRGHLLYVSSIAGKTTVPGNPLYHASKYGLRGFASALRQDLHGSGVGVSCIFPGFIRGAGMFADSGAKLPPGTGTRSPQDVALAVAEAIERDRGEVDVAALPQRAGAAFANFAPELAAAVVRRAGGLRIAQEMERSLGAKR